MFSPALVELFPTKTMTAIETASVILNHIGRFGSPEVIHTDKGPAFHNELITELFRLGGIQQSFATAYSSEENGIVCDPAVRTGTTCTAMSTSLSLPGPLHITYHVRYTYHVSTTAQRCTTSIVLT